MIYFFIEFKKPKLKISLKRLGSMLRLRRAKDVNQDQAYLYTQRFSKYYHYYYYYFIQIIYNFN